MADNISSYLQYRKPEICACRKCRYINYINNNFCTHCGFPLRDDRLAKDYYDRIYHRKNLKLEAQSSILITRTFLYCMGGFILSGAAYMFIKLHHHAVVTIMAVMLALLFFTLAVWSKKNPFTSLLTSFVILMTFTAINIFAKFTQTFTTLSGITGITICLVLLFIVLKGVQAAYRINMIDEELQAEQ